MKAIVYYNYGSPDVLKCEEIEKPAAGDNEVLIKVRAASVNPLDWHFMRGMPYIVRIMAGLRKPKVTRLGVDVAGQVEAVGRNVTQFKPGDEVFGCVPWGLCRVCVCFRVEHWSMKPDNVTFEQAASVPVAAFTALQGLRDKGQIQPGQKVLINGAAGGVGTFAVQIAKSFGAEVTGVCSTRNVDMVRSIGADQVIDYTQEDFTKSGQRYDLLLRLRWEPFVVGMQARLESQGDIHRGRRTERPVDDRSSGAFDHSACVVTVREPEAGHVSGETEQRGPDHHARAHGDRKGDTGHRQALQVE